MRRHVDIARRPRITGTLIFALALAVRVGNYFRAGKFFTFSDTKLYLHTCKVLGVQTSPLIARYFESPGNTMVGVFYSGYLLPFCSTVGITNSLVAWGVVNIVISSLTCVVVYLAARRYFGYATGLLAGLVMVVHFDAFRWSVFYMSEPLFVFTISLALWRIAEYRHDPTRRNGFLLAASLLWVAVTRPFGPLYVSLTALVLLWIRYRTNVTEELRRHPAQALGTAVGFVVALPFFLFSNQFLNWDIAQVEFLLSRVWTNDQIFIGGQSPGGILLPGSLEYFPDSAPGPFRTVLVNADRLVLVAVLKVAGFFYPFPFFWDISHTAHFVGTFVYVAVLVIAVLGSLGLRRRDPVLVTILLVPILATLVFTVVVGPEMHFRYRSPLTPFFVILAAAYVESRIPLEIPSHDESA